MSGVILPLVVVLLIWMAACAWAGFARRFVAFLGILIVGLMLNTAWMVIALDATPFEANAVIAQGAATLYAVCAFGSGWFAGRIRRAWRQSRVE